MNHHAVLLPTCRVEEVKIDELSLDNDDCVLASDPTEDSYEDLGALFTNSKPGNEKVVKFHVNSVSIVELVEDVAFTETDPNRSDTKTRKTAPKFRISLKTEAKSMKKAIMGRKEGRRPGLEGIVVIWPMQRAMKSEDHD